MNLSAEYFRVWRTNKDCLEEAVTMKESLRRQAEETNAPRPYFSFLCQVDKYFQAIDQVRAAGRGGMNYSHTETLNRAEKAVIEAAAATLGRKFLFNETEARLDGLVLSWEQQKENKGREDCLKEIMDVCSYYGPATAVGSFLLPEKFNPNAFYGDLGRLSFIASSDLAKDYVNKYSRCSSLGELKRFKAAFEQDFVEQVKSLRKELGCKYNPKKHPRENKLIHSEPLASFRQLYRELQQNRSSSEWQDLFSARVKIFQEIGKTEASMAILAEEPRLKDDYIARVSALSLKEANFGWPSFLYLEENLRQYQAVLNQEKALLELRRKQALDLIHAGINASAEEMNLQISLKGDKSGYLKNKKNEVEHYKKQLQLLGFPGDVPLKFIEQKVDTLARSYGVLLDQFGEKKETEVRTPKEGVPAAIKPTGDVSHIDSSLISPLNSPLELVNFAHQRSSDATDAKLARLCKLVAGVQDSRFDQRSFLERIQEANSIILPGLVGDDFRIYAALREGFALVGK